MYKKFDIYFSLLKIDPLFVESGWMKYPQIDRFIG